VGTCMQLENIRVCSTHRGAHSRGDHVPKRLAPADEHCGACITQQGVDMANCRLCSMETPKQRCKHHGHCSIRHSCTADAST
jgi:hypothetical protein